MHRLIPIVRASCCWGPALARQDHLLCGLAALQSKIGKVVYFVGAGSAEKDVTPWRSIHVQPHSLLRSDREPGVDDDGKGKGRHPRRGSSASACTAPT